MARLSETIGNLNRLKAGIAGMAASLPGTLSATPVSTPLRQVEAFGSNPGALNMWVHAPERLATAPGLVVVLHGCTQTAAGYDAGVGWSTLATRYGFVVLCPEQTRANNQQACFNWFSPEDTARGRGEALSIRQMIDRTVADHGIDRSRIFITGLSAGGAMAAAMLAAYPEVFAGGGIVAGLPAGAAASLPAALSAMRQSPARTPAEWAGVVRRASDHVGPWPRVSIWHGGADTVVSPSNQASLVSQWTGLHGLPAEPTGRERLSGVVRESWRDAAGREMVESFTVPGMGHGAPIEAGSGDEMAGAAGPFIFDVGISSSYRMARFWGLADTVLTRETPPAGAAAGSPMIVAPDGTVEVTRAPAPGRARPEAAPRPSGVAQVIDDALRAAGLKR